MHYFSSRHAGWLLALAPLVLTGCLLAAGGAAAGSGIYLTTRGAEGVVHGTVEELTSASRTAFERLGVQYDGQRDQDDGGREVYGATDDGEVTVDLTRRTDNATKVHVAVKTGTVTWDKDMAKRILEEIQGIREE
jgi:hypothetical protein